MVARARDRRLHVWPEGVTRPGPPKQFTRKVLVYLTEEQGDLIENASDERSVSQGVIVREALNLYFEGKSDGPSS
jgi:hypothetical protein